MLAGRRASRLDGVPARRSAATPVDRPRCSRPNTGVPALERQGDLGQRPVGAADGDARRRRLRTTSPLRSSPSPVGDGHRDPLGWPPADRRRAGCRWSVPPAAPAPRQAAAMTPPRPPQTTMRARAGAEPAHRLGHLRPRLVEASPAPDDGDVHGAGQGLADDDVDQLVGHDDHLDDSWPSSGPSRRATARASRSSSSRGAPVGARDAVAHLAVDQADELEGVGLEHRRVGVRPRLLPHPARRSAARRPRRPDGARTGTAARRPWPWRTGAPPRRPRGGGRSR